MTPNHYYGIIKLEHTMFIFTDDEVQIMVAIEFLSRTIQEEYYERYPSDY